MIQDNNQMKLSEVENRTIGLELQVLWDKYNRMSSILDLT